MPTILLSAPYLIPAIGRFQEVLDAYQLDLIQPPVTERLSEVEILQYAGSFDGTICGDDRYTASVLNACAPRLKVISKWGTGIDSIDKTEAEKLGIGVGCTPNAFTLPVADSVLAYMLAFARQQPWLDKAMKAGVWKKIPGRSLAECTLGVVGVGNVGKAVLRRGRAFGMRLLGNDIVPIATDFLAEFGVEMTSLADLLSRADFIALCCDLNPTSHHLINAETLEHARLGAVLINTSRGPVVSEPDLINALKCGRLAGAGLDVFEEEPLPLDSPLLKLDNVLLAPHNSNSSPTAWERVHWNTLRNLVLGLGYSDNALQVLKQKISPGL